jgi:hypothetical protein
MQTASGARLDLKRIALLLLFLAVGWFFWHKPALLPLKLLVVMMHESGHALATWLVGGEVQRVTLRVDQSGECFSLLPAGVFRQIIVFSAGYLGSAMAGAVLLLATYRYRLRHWVLGAACVWLAVMGVLYARDPFTLAFCLGTAAVLGLAARFLPDAAVDVVNLFLAAFTALYAVFDFRDDLWNPAVRSHSDAGLLAQQTWVPAVVWAGLWTLLGFALLGWAVYKSMHGDHRSARMRMPPLSSARRS